MTALLDGVVVVPPCIKVSTGPLLGPALLVGAAQTSGLRCELLDLNRSEMERKGILALDYRRTVLGDHDGPREALRVVEKEWAEAFGDVRTLATHDEVACRVAQRRNEPLTRWLAMQLDNVHVARVYGISIMHEGQVLPALLVSELLRERIPKAKIVFGGAHISALATEIANDVGYGRWCDGFVRGYAEGTWVDILIAAQRDENLPRECAAAGSGAFPPGRQVPSTAPKFESPGRYRRDRLTLPAQASRGCHYGKCSFCSYPAVEGSFLNLPPASWLPVVRAARGLNAAVSFKDSFLREDLLSHIAEACAGDVCWSGCTRVSSTLNAEFLLHLHGSGCRTLELGVETILPEAQRRLTKRQPLRLLEQVISACPPGLTLVLNYMTGLPGTDAADEEGAFEWLQALIRHTPEILIEHNSFVLVRASPMGQKPDGWGMRVTGSPVWSTLLGYEIETSPVEGSSRTPRRALLDPMAALIQ